MKWAAIVVMSTRVALLPHEVPRENSDLTVFTAISSDLKVPTSEIPGNSFEGTVLKAQLNFTHFHYRGPIMLFRFFLHLLRLTYVLGYINGWQSYNTIKFPQGEVNDYSKSLLPSYLETARWDFLRGFLLLPVHGDVSMYFCWESMGELHQ